MRIFRLNGINKRIALVSYDHNNALKDVEVITR